MACFPELKKQLSPGCEELLKTGWTGRARLYQYSRGGVTVTIDSPAKVSSIKVPETGGASPVRYYDASLVDAFTGTSVAGNADSGRVMFKKTIALKIPYNNIYFASGYIVEPMLNDTEGFLILLERRDGAWIVFGAYDACVGDVSSYAQNEYENNGMYTLNLTCTEYVAEVYYTGDTSNW